MSEPKRTGLLQLLGNSLGCQFVIPVYQRNYTWAAEREVKQYFDDLQSVLKGDYKNHFMGIIIYLEKAIDFSSREFSIIDGQQRLTTTFLIIYAIKQLLVNCNDTEKVKQLEGQYLTNPYHNDKIKYKLKPLVSDDDVYRCIVEDRMDDITDKESNVLKNYQYISNRLNELLLQGYDANAILMALDKLYVVCVPISEEDNAQKIFESINATGVKLTSADLIRKRFSVSNRIYDSIPVMFVSFVLRLIGGIMWLVGMVGLVTAVYNLIVYRVFKDIVGVGPFSLVILLLGAIFILAADAFEKETDSNKIYAYSASIIALVSCIVSIIALVGM